MTAIVGFTRKGKVYIAGDSLGSNDYHKQTYTQPKVFKNKDFVIGYTTSFRLGQILEFDFIPPDRENGISDYKYLISYFIPKLRECLEKNKFTKSDDVSGGGSFLLGYRNKLYIVQADWSIVCPTEGIASVGSGMDLCLGSLYSLKNNSKLSPKEICIKAIESASHFNPYVGGKIDVVVLDKYEEGEIN